MDIEDEAGAAGADVLSPTCPSRKVLELVANKWALLVITALHRESLRNNELLRRVGGISQKVLTQTLRELQRNGFVEREDAGTLPLRVDYRLTALGRSLSEVLQPVDRWAEQNYAAVQRAQRGEAPLTEG